MIKTLVSGDVVKIVDGNNTLLFFDVVVRTFNEERIWFRLRTRKYDFNHYMTVFLSSSLPSLRDYGYRAISPFNSNDALSFIFKETKKEFPKARLFINDTKQLVIKGIKDIQSVKEITITE